jgi:hypothetical protein
MPYADPRRSFGAAVRHLFRHLDDPLALARNPVACDVFATLSSPSIRSNILDGGRVCYAEDVARGRVAKAKRHYAILSAICRGRPAKEIARGLSISLPQFYRDRRVVCERVVRALLAGANETKAFAFAQDPLRFALWRAAALAEQGFAAKAVAECERILADTHAPASKALTLLKLGDAALRLGDVPRAQESVRIARDFAAHARGQDSIEIEILAQLIEYRLAMYGGVHEEAFRIIRGLSGESDPPLVDRLDRDDVRIEVLLERCRSAAYEGQLSTANAAVARAAAIAKDNSSIPLPQRVEIAVFGASFAQDGINDPGTRLLGLNEALTFAFAAGSAMGALFASIGLAHACTMLRDAAHAKSHADRALQMARLMDGRQPLLFTVASLAPVLMRLQRWADLDPLLFDIESCAVPMTDLWVNLKLSQGALLAYRGGNEAALAPLASAIDGARKLHRPRLQAMALREFALSSHGAGRADDARDYIQSALRVVEGSRDPLELHLTYRAASKILRDARMHRLAAQTAAMMARN